MRRLFDSITAADIPAGSELVAGYIDGSYRWSDADWARFTGRVPVRIAVLPSTNDGEVLDVEPGDATPTQAVDWVRMRRAAGADPSIYAGIGDWQAVRDAFTSAGEAEPHYWIASWDGAASIPPGAVAKQYANPTLTGGHFDASVVADYWPGVDVRPPINGDQAKDLIREMLESEEGAQLVYDAISHKYGPALQAQLDELKAALLAADSVTEVKAVVESLLDVQPFALKPGPR